MVSTERYIHTNGKFTILGKREGCNIAVLNLSFNAGLSKMWPTTQFYMSRETLFCWTNHAASHTQRQIGIIALNERKEEGKF